VTNQGDVATVGLTIHDLLEHRVPPNWFTLFNQPVTVSGQIPADTTVAFPYSYDADALPTAVAIRNTAIVTILNHSGHLGVPWGPNPKTDWEGEVQPCPADLGCTYTQGYWGNKPDVVWPDPYSRDATFFLSGQTWQQVMDTPVNVSQGYYQLAHQYIAAVLNKANGAYVPQGVQDTLNLAYAWLGATGPSACTGGGSCGTQKDWAAILDQYNNGLYPGGPGHCGDESPNIH